MMAMAMDIDQGFSSAMVLVFLVASLLVLNHSVEGSGRWKLSKEEDMEIERQLRSLNKPFVKSFKTEHGDIFDCVDIYKQPAFDHPLLKNHTIQMAPFALPEGLGKKHSSRKRLPNTILNVRCPPGTVIIRRTQKEDLIKAKKHIPYHPSDDLIVDGNHYAGVSIRSKNSSEPLKYYGAQATMDVFNVPNVSKNQASGAKILLMKGATGPADHFNTIQFGWLVFPARTGDDLTRLFAHWTSDGYQKTGCYNLLCPGFVQISKSWTLGMVLPTGTEAIKLSAYKEAATQKWLLVAGEFEVIGYWPKEIFNNMADVSEVQIGGVVYSPFDEPSPPMGNGIAPILPFWYRSCEFVTSRFLNDKGQFEAFHVDTVSEFSDIPEYYNVNGFQPATPALEYRVVFGGPGGYKQQ